MQGQRSGRSPKTSARPPAHPFLCPSPQVAEPGDSFSSDVLLVGGGSGGGRCDRRAERASFLHQGSATSVAPSTVDIWQQPRRSASSSRSTSRAEPASGPTVTTSTVECQRTTPHGTPLWTT